MKRVIYTVAALMLTVSGFAQKDTTKPNEPDTIKVGNFVIVKKNKSSGTYDTSSKTQVLVDIGSGEGTSHYHYHRPLITTNWLIFDLGFANWRDKTVYGSTEANQYLNAQGGAHLTDNDLD